MYLCYKLLNYYKKVILNHSKNLVIYCTDLIDDNIIRERISDSLHVF